MRLRIVAVIARKDLAAIRRSRALWLPMLILPLMFFIAVPALLTYVYSHLPERDLAKLLGQLPAGMLDGAGDRHAPGFVIRVALRQLMAPLALLVPVLVATVTAADAFAGERERKTLEALLHTPATDVEIFAGKVLASWLPATLTDLGGSLALITTVNVVGHAQVGLYLPDAGALLIMLWLGPAAAGLSLTLMVFVSSRVRGFQEATQLGGLVVLPVLGLLATQMTGTLFLGPFALAVAGAVVYAIDLVLVYAGAASFTRDRLFLRL